MCTLRLQRSGCSAGSVIKRRSGAGSGSRCASQHPTIPHIAHVLDTSAAQHIAILGSRLEKARHWLPRPECVLYVNCPWVRGHIFTVLTWHHSQLAADPGPGSGPRQSPGKFQYWVSKYLNIKILCPHTLCLFPNCQSNEIVKLFRLLKILLIHQLEYLHDLQFCVK